MADINRNLLKALDGPAPQWLKGNDFVPMGDGNPLPVSNYVQGANGVWVPVSENNPVPAKLLGSNVKQIELISHISNITVPASTIVRAIRDVDISSYRELFIQFLPGGSYEYSISIFPYRFEQSVALTQEIVFENKKGDTSNKIIDSIRVKGLRCDIGIINTGNSDHTFSGIGLFGVRA